MNPRTKETLSTTLYRVANRKGGTASVTPVDALHLIRTHALTACCGTSSVIVFTCRGSGAEGMKVWTLQISASVETEDFKCSSGFTDPRNRPREQVLLWNGPFRTAANIIDHSRVLCWEETCKDGADC